MIHTKVCNFFMVYGTIAAHNDCSVMIMRFYFFRCELCICTHRLHQQHILIVLGMINFRLMSGRSCSVEPEVGLYTDSLGSNKCLISC
jgi:hypothetical protein